MATAAAAPARSLPVMVTVPASWPLSQKTLRGSGAVLAMILLLFA